MTLMFVNCDVLTKSSDPGREYHTFMKLCKPHRASLEIQHVREPVVVFEI